MQFNPIAKYTFDNLNKEVVLSYRFRTYIVISRGHHRLTWYTLDYFAGLRSSFAHVWSENKLSNKVFDRLSVMLNSDRIEGS